MMPNIGIKMLSYRKAYYKLTSYTILHS